MTYQPEPIPSELTPAYVGRELRRVAEAIVARPRRVGYPVTDAERLVGAAVVDTRWPPGDIRRYGAMGDGTQDDSGAIQTAIDVVGVTGGVVAIPEGEWVVQQALSLDSPGVRLAGRGAASILKADADSPVVMLTASHTSVQSVRIIGDTAGNNAQRGVYAAGAVDSPLSNLVILDLTVESVGSFGVYLLYCADSRVDGLTVIGAGDSACVASNSQRVAVANIVAHANAGKTASFVRSEDCVAANILSINSSGEVGYTNGSERIAFCNLIGVGMSTSAVKFSRDSRECSITGAYLVSDFAALYFQGSSDCSAVNVRGIALGSGQALRINSHDVTMTGAHRNRVANSTFLSDAGSALWVRGNDVIGQDNHIENCHFSCLGPSPAMDIRASVGTAVSGGSVRAEAEGLSASQGAERLVVRGLAVRAEGDAITVAVPGAVFHACEVHSTLANGFRLLAGAQGAKIMHCTVSSPLGDGIDRATTTTEIAAAFNVFGDGIGTPSANVIGYDTNLEM